MGDIMDYHPKSDDNIAKSKYSEAISSILKNLSDDVKDLQDTLSVSKKIKTDVETDVEISQRKTLHERYTMIPRRSVRTRRTSKDVYKDEDDDGEMNVGTKGVDSGVRKRRYKRKSVSSASAPEPLPPEEITQEMIKNIHIKGIKKYDSVRGVLCHQCRQKTLDTKTMCRSGKCIGGQGAFCGPCLNNHYGEKVEVALKDPNWACPPCKNMCICSVHMISRGMRPAGTLTPVALKRGYKCVLDYLVAEKILKTNENGIVLDSD